MSAIDDSPIIGIDLGTTNSVVAAYIDGRIRVLEEQGTGLLPSVVGVSADGKLLIGQAAKNQLVAFPERTLASVKRRMGEAVNLKMADEEYSPQEISAMILRRLKDRAEQVLGRPATRAVITVPAFFDEGQRQATREAGELAGLTIERIINEPTAAALVYHAGQTGRRHLVIYDLGGGTFDVSIVRMEDGVVEVLSSKGDTKLGGDDFDTLLMENVAERFSSEHGVDLTENASTRWRLLQACERAKRELSQHAFTRVSEEFIAEVDGKPLSLDVRIDRYEYEELINPLVERTIRCVDEALNDASLTTSQIDELILVGGSSRTPLVRQRLLQELHHEAHWAVNPDLAVALGAATQAAMQSGASVGPVLVDVATHTLGIECARGSRFNPTIGYAPILHRNSPLPARHEDTFSTMFSDQEEAEIRVFQGESPNLQYNKELGSFRLSGLNKSAEADGSIVVRFELTLDGTLSVTAVERLTGITKSLKIRNALTSQSEATHDSAVERLGMMFSDSDDVVASEVGVSDAGIETGEGRVDGPHSTLLMRVEKVRSDASDEDAEDIDRLLQAIEEAEQRGDQELVDSIRSELEDLLFYIEG